MERAALSLIPITNAERAPCGSKCPAKYGPAFELLPKAPWRLDAVPGKQAPHFPAPEISETRFG